MKKSTILPINQQDFKNSIHSRFQSQFNLSSDSLSTTYHQIQSSINLKSLLFSRSRITNLAVIILSFTLIISLYFNLIHQNSKNFSIHQTQSIQSFKSIQNTLTQPKSNLKRLIIVPGHAIFIGNDPFNSNHWLLESYQSNSSILTFINHIKEGIKLNLLFHDSLLIYSGGHTRINSNSTLTESNSYSRIANLLNLYQFTFNQLLNDNDHDLIKNQKFNVFEFLTNRVTTEEFALDSWTNLLFSVARFKEFTGHYPNHITVIGHSFKSKRFQEIHRNALRWSSTKFDYVSIKDENDDLENRYLGEKEVYTSFEFDKYGCFGKLKSKRINRNPFRRFHSYLISNFELIGLFEWCPSNGIDWYPGKLPWSNLT